MAAEVRVLIVDDDAKARRELALILGEMGYRIEKAGSGREALEKARETFFHLALIDNQLPDRMWAELIAPMQEMCPEMTVILVASSASVETEISALNAGAAALITKPWHKDQVLAITNRTLEMRRLVMEHRQLLAEHERVEDTLRESEERFQRLTEAAIEGIAITDQGEIIDVNDTLAKMMGYTPAEVIGRSVMDLVAPESREFVATKIQSGHEKVYEHLALRKDGSTFPVEVHGKAISYQERFVRVTAVRDITERVQAEARSRKLSLAVENSPSAVLIYDTSGVIEYVNPRFVRITGYAPEEIIGKHVSGLGDNTAEENKRIWGAILTEGEWRGEILNRKKDGGSYWVSTSVSSIRDQQNDITHFVEVQEDITDRRQAEEEIQQKTEDIALINSLNNAINQGSSFLESIQQFARVTAKVFQSYGITVYLLSKDKESLVMQNLTLPPKVVKGIEMLIGRKIQKATILLGEESYYGRVIRAGRTRLADDPAAIKGMMAEFTQNVALRKIVPKVFKLLRIRSVLSVPLISEGETVGLMDISAKRVFTKLEQERLEAVARQLTVLIKRKQAEEALWQRNRELSLLNRVIASAASSLDLEAVLETTCRELAKAFEVPQVGAALLDETGTMLRAMAGYMAEDGPTGSGAEIRVVGNPAVQYVLEQKVPLTVTDARHEPSLALVHELMRWRGLGSMLLLPLIVGDRVAGIIGLNTAEQREFTQDEIALATSAVTASAQVLEKAQLLEDEQRNARRLTDILELSTDLATVREENRLLNMLVTRIARFADSPTCTVLLLDETANEAVLAAQTGLPEGTPSDLHISLTLPIIRRSLETGEPIIISDIDRGAPEMRAVLVRPEVRAFFAYPMIREGRTVGFMTLSSLTPYLPSSTEVTAYRMLAERAAAALENVRLLAQLQQRNLELNRLHRASGALFSGTVSGIKHLAQDIVETIQREFKHSNCSLFLNEGGSAGLRRLAAVGPYATQLSQWSFPLEGKGLVPAAVRTGAILNVPDVAAHPDYAQGWQPTRSELTIPLIVDNRVIGAIDLQSAKSADFDLDDERLLAAFAERAALALQNARLFAESQRRTEELETLREASLQLTSSLDQHEVMTSILRNAVQLADAKDAHAFLYDEQKLSFGAAFWVDGEDQQELYTDPRPGGITETVALTGKRLVIPDVDSHPLFEDWQWGGAIIGLPLIVGGRTLGVMNVAFSKPRAFQENELRILELLASQAAVALENTRLFDETRRRAEELEAMVKVSLALRTAEAQSDMVPIILDEVFDLLNADGVALTMRDEATGESMIELARGAWQDINGARMSVGQSISGQLLDTRQPFQTVCVSLIAQETAIGDLWVGRKQTISRRENRLVAAIADIAANAIQRARLHEQTVRHAAELERRVAARTNALSIANAELTRANRAKDEFLANMSHELRTPLSNVLVRVEMLQKGIYGPLIDKQMRSLGVIEDSGRHLLQLINDILDVSKIEAGKLELDVRPVSVASICESSLQFVKEVAAQKGIQIHTDIQSEVVQADGRRLKQILVNLLSNAVKFTPEGGQIGLKVAGDAATELIQFAVWDTGVGINSNDMTRLFQPFSQLDGSLSRRFEGTGLGLALVRRLTEIHGGSVSVESEEDQGSRFTVVLPWHAKERATGSNDRHQEAEERGIDFSRPAISTADPPITILLAEDNEVLIGGLVEYLSLSGYRVIVARNGTEAVKRAKENGPDLIMMDIQMPGIDGLEAMRQIRAAGSRAIPIIALTALAMPGDRERCLEAGASEYLSKPIRLGYLSEAIEKYLHSAGEKESGST